MRSLDSFAATVLRSLGRADSGAVVIEAVVVRAPNLEALLSQQQLPSGLRHDTAIVAETAAELQPLLSAALGDSVDFLFIPSPKPFVLYADHDEYATFFANSKSNLTAVASALTASGFTPVANYTRTS